MHPESLNLMNTLLLQYVRGAIPMPWKVLDVGSLDVNGSYRVLFKDDDVEYTGLDIVEGKGVDIVVENPYWWHEVLHDVFDVVISGSMLEHATYPWESMKQIHRALKPGGYCVTVAPGAGEHSHGYHGYPSDCFRFFPDGMASLHHWAGLMVLESRQVRGSAFDDCGCVSKKPIVAR